MDFRSSNCFQLCCELLSFPSQGISPAEQAWPLSLPAPGRGYLGLFLVKPTSFCGHSSLSAVGKSLGFFFKQTLRGTGLSQAWLTSALFCINPKFSTGMEMQATANKRADEILRG